MKKYLIVTRKRSELAGLKYHYCHFRAFSEISATKEIVNVQRSLAEM